VSVVNSTIQRSFPYLGQEVLLNSNVIFDGYELNAWSGFRIAAKFDFSYFLMNGNAISLSYNWDACKTGADLPVFELAQHYVLLSFLYNFN
jgi:hypothetical protein